MPRGAVIALGMGAELPNRLPDGSITASSEWIHDQTGEEGRSDETGRALDARMPDSKKTFHEWYMLPAWTPRHDECHSTLDGEWLQIAFARPVELVAVETQGKYGGGGWGVVHSYDVRTSDDGFAWELRATLEGCRTQNLERRRAELPSPVVTRFVRIYPRQYWHRPSMRLELYGRSTPEPTAAVGGGKVHPAADASYDDDEAIARALRGEEDAAAAEPDAEEAPPSAAAVVGEPRDLRPDLSGATATLPSRPITPSRPSGAVRGAARGRRPLPGLGLCARDARLDRAHAARGGDLGDAARRRHRRRPRGGGRGGGARAARSARARARCASRSVTATSRSARMSVLLIHILRTGVLPERAVQGEHDGARSDGRAAARRVARLPLSAVPALVRVGRLHLLLARRDHARRDLPLDVVAAADAAVHVGDGENPRGGQRRVGRARRQEVPRALGRVLDACVAVLVAGVALMGAHGRPARVARPAAFRGDYGAWCAAGARSGDADHRRLQVYRAALAGGMMASHDEAACDTCMAECCDAHDVESACNACWEGTAYDGPLFGIAARLTGKLDAPTGACFIATRPDDAAGWYIYLMVISSILLCVYVRLLVAAVRLHIAVARLGEPLQCGPAPPAPKQDHTIVDISKEISTVPSADARKSDGRFALGGGTAWVAEFAGGEFRPLTNAHCLHGRGVQVQSASTCVVPGWCRHGSTFKYSAKTDAWLETDHSKGRVTCTWTRVGY